MLTLKQAYDVLPNRQVTIQLPPTVPLGHHEIVIVLDTASNQEAVAKSDICHIMQFSGVISKFTAIDGMDYQNKIRAEWN